ncbi:lysophospholipid acyltransferase family protein [Streptomyces sp. ML-6]|uniref:lysophospholipid acyltransferase family protein n=1 Tax=Streptomyces sp. ML-6 TaxID=2982693 RepID=UPI0024C051C9|nr:lysophospholipid acyltransferase family protein [Streptomyces sp. ML-6]MDK0523634.1 1-acyl-sn-glycerol-3-phosphate acyltransferase [Streptomyces sp. ML-6]
MNPWLPAAPCTPGDCATHHGRSRGRPAAAGLLLAGAAVILAGALAAPFVLMLGPARRQWLIRHWAYGVVRAFGVRVRVTGPPAPTDAPTHPTGHPTGAAPDPPRPAAGRPDPPGPLSTAPDSPGPPGTAPDPPGTLVVANHISWLDVPLVAAVFPGRMLAKREIRDWPLLGPLAALGGTLFVERDRLRALPTTVRDIAAALRGGSCVVVFPEGTTWCGHGPGGRFSPAAFQAAIDAGATVRPVRIAYRAAPAGSAGRPRRAATRPATGARPRRTTPAQPRSSATIRSSPRCGGW